jgi:hypothetical protein
MLSLHLLSKANGILGACGAAPWKENYCISRRRARAGIPPDFHNRLKNNIIYNKKTQGALIDAPCSKLFMIKLFAFVVGLTSKVDAKLSEGVSVHLGKNNLQQKVLLPQGDLYLSIISKVYKYMQLFLL